MTARFNALTLADIRPYLRNVHKRSGQLTAACPVCGDDHHLYVKQDGSTLLMYCQKCNAKFEDILKAFKAQGAKPAEPVAPPELQKKPVLAVAEEYDHIYRNPDGSEAYRKHRIKYVDGSKKFAFGYQDAAGTVIYKKPPACNNLYNLDLLDKADPGTTLYIVEGEKCADSMTKNGLLATTANTGAQKSIKLSPTDARLLNKFPQRVVIPDNDDKGFEYCQAWPGTKVLNLKDIWPELPVKGDVADYFAAGLPVEKITGYRWAAPVDLDRAYFEKLDKFQLIDEKLFEAITSITEPDERQKVVSMATFRATALGMVREFNKCFRAYNQAQAQKQVKSDNMTRFPLQPFAINCGEWAADEHGVRKLYSQNGSDFKYVFASPIPVMPTEILTNAEDGTEKIRLAYYKDGKWRSIVVPRVMAASANKILDLADHGLEVNSDNAKMLVKFIADCVALNPTILPRVKSVGHLGWTGSDFVPYNGEIKLDCEEQYKTLISSVAETGDLDAWVNYVKPLRKNIYLRLIMAASFASVLIEKVHALPFVLHLWGGTGSGKTVGMMVAASIWGNPRFGHMVRTMNMTINSMMATAAVLRNLPFFGDELQTIKSRYESYDTLIMRVCEGVDRGRMTNVTLQKQNTWANAFVFTGEEPCTKQSSGGGVKNRVIEIEVDGQVVDQGNAVVSFVNSNYGAAGRVFVESLKDRKLKPAYDLAFNALLKADTTEKQAMSMALMIVADDIAEEVFFKSGHPLLLTDVQPYLKTTSEIDTAERAYNTLMDLISENGDKFESPIFADRRNPGIIWGKKDTDGVLINKMVLERELNNLGFEFSAVKKKWLQKNYIQKNSQGRTVTQTTVNGIKGNFVKILAKM